MLTIEQLSHQLGKGTSIETTVTDIAAKAEEHYLSYFMNNLSFEITTFYELLAEDSHKVLLDDNDVMKKIIQSMTKVWSDTEKWLNPSKRSITMKLSTLYKYRDTLANQVATLAAYDDKLKMYQYSLSRRKNHEGVSLYTSDEALAGEVVNFIFEHEDSMTVNDRAKLVLGELPVRMSKIKFHEWVEIALVGMKGVSVNDLSNYTEYLKETFYPEGVAGYGLVTPKFFDALQSLEQVMTDIVATDVIDEMEETINNLQLMLNDSVSLYTLTASVINNMIGLLSVLNETSMAECHEDATRFITLMNRLYKRRREEEIIDDEMMDVFNEMTLEFSEIMMHNGKYDALIDQVKKGHVDVIISLGLEERYDRLATLYILQSSSFFAPVQVSATDLELVNEGQLILMKNELLAYLDEGAKDNTRIEKRARIANLFSVLNVIHGSAQELHTYILSALTACRDEREKQGCKRVLEEIMSTSL